VLQLAAGAHGDFRDEVLVDNPFLYYEFEETTGTTASDSSSGGVNDGTYSEQEPGGFTLGGAGPVGLAVELDGDIGGWIEIAPTGVATGTWTIEMIVRADGLADDCCTSLFSTSDYPDAGGTTGGAVHFNFEDDGNLILIDAPSTGETEYEVVDPIVNTGQFVHIVATSDNVNSLSRRVYVNGGLLDEVDLLGAGGLSSFNGVSNVGALDGAVRFLTGAFDEFAIYNTVLDESDVLRHFAASGLAPSFSLTIDRDTGSAILENITEANLTLNSYSVLSAAGTLDPDAWDTISPDNGWVISEESDLELAEGGATGVTLTPGATLNLGSLWKPFFREEVRFEGIDGAGEDLNALIIYEGIGIEFADLDLDGDIDVQDYVSFANTFDDDVTDMSFYDAYFRSDLTGDGLKNFEDFIVFADAFDAVNGAGAFQAMLAGIPEPSTLLLIAVGFAGVAAIRRVRRTIIATQATLAVAIAIACSSTADAAELVEYLFTSNFNDTSGNNRHGIPSLGTAPTVSGGKLQLGGDFEEGLIVPLGAANPFGGLNDYTLEMTFNTSGSTVFPEAGVILFGSADQTDPTLDDNQSMSIFIEPEADGGSLVVDYFFVGEVRIQDAMLLDGADHSIKVTYVAPDDPGTEDDPNPGTMYLNLDGDWLAVGELAPRQPNPANFEARIGGSLNEDFPFDCVEGGCFTTEFEGSVDDFRIFNDAMPPSLLRAEVDLTTGAVTILGGEFHRDVRYYEISSESGSLNPGSWNSFEEQNLDPLGTGPGQHWDELAASDSQLAESFLLGSSVFDENRTISLGNVFEIGGTQDLEFIAVTSDLEDIPVEVSFVNAPPLLPGDYNEDGSVNAADYVVWRKTNGSPEGYNTWRTNFGRTTPGSGADVGNHTAVPEPNAVLLLGFLAALRRLGQRTSNRAT
jgi:hypothetical protein